MAPLFDSKVGRSRTEYSFMAASSVRCVSMIWSFGDSFETVRHAPCDMLKMTRGDRQRFHRHSKVGCCLLSTWIRSRNMGMGTGDDPDDARLENCSPQVADSASTLR